jgi:hypothetical protein
MILHRVVFMEDVMIPSIYFGAAWIIHSHCDSCTIVHVPVSPATKTNCAGPLSQCDYYLFHWPGLQM